MKRTLLLIFAAIIVAATAAVTVVYIHTSGDADEGNQRAPIEDMFTIYVDIEQLVEKGAIENFITPEYRRTLATMAGANIEDPDAAAYIESVVNDLSQLGLNLSQPAYIYGNATNDQVDNIAVIIEVRDPAKLDRFFTTFIENGNTEAQMTQNGENRIITNIDESTLMIGYNTTRLAMVIHNTSYDTLYAMTEDALARPLSDLSIFGNRDIAAYVDIAQAMNLAESWVEAQKAYQEELANEYSYDYEVASHNATIAEYDAMLTQIAAMREYYTDEATIITGLTFDAGRATIDVTTNGFDTSAYTETYKRTSNTNLQYVEDNVIAAMNFGVNGVKLSEYINNNMPENAAAMFNMNPTEFNVFLAVALDMIETINGDVMIAVNDFSLNGNSSSNYIDAIAIAEVSDNYIYSMATQFGAGMLHPAGENLYTFRFPPFTGYFGQQQNALFASLGTSLTMATNPATACNWYRDIENSYAYIIIDVENLMQNELVSMTYSMMLAGQGSEAQLIDNFVQISDYVYVKLDEPNRLELSYVLKDKETNALQQIIEQLVASTNSVAIPSATLDTI